MASLGATAYSQTVTHHNKKETATMNRHRITKIKMRTNNQLKKEDKCDTKS